MLGNLSKREKNILSVTVLLVLCIAGWFYVYEPLMLWNEELDGEISAAKDRLYRSTKNYQNLSRIEKEYEDVVKNLRIEGNDSDKQLAIMKEMEGLMKEAEIKPGVAKPLAVVDEDRYQIFPFSYDDTETSMVALASFLQILEERSKVSEIQVIEIKQPSPKIYEPGEQRFKTNYRISRLVYRNNEEAKKTRR